MSKTLALMGIAEKIGMLDEAQETFSGCLEQMKNGKELKPETIENLEKLTSREAVMRRLVKALDKVIETDEAAQRALEMSEDPVFATILHNFGTIMKAVTMETMHEVAQSFVKTEDMEDIMDFLYERIKDRST